MNTSNGQPPDHLAESLPHSLDPDNQIQVLRTTGIGKVAGGSAVLGAAMIAILALVSTYNVVQRTISGAPVPGVIDLTTLGIVFVAFAGVAEAEIDETHVRVAGVVDKLPKVPGRLVRALSELIMSVLVAVMIWATSERAWDAYRIGERQYGGEEWIVWPFRFVIVAGLVLLLTVCIMKFVRTVRRLCSGSESGIVRAED